MLNRSFDGLVELVLFNRAKGGPQPDTELERGVRREGWVRKKVKFPE